MANIKLNLNNLFKNYQQQQQYNKKEFDVNGDGKVNLNDNIKLTSEQNNLLKNQKLFDFNNDRKTKVYDKTGKLMSQENISSGVNINSGTIGKTVLYDKISIEDNQKIQ